MAQVDLITGFLGAGKTTFLRHYAKYLMKRQKIAVIENDYGAVNVDRMLLQDLQGENCELETVAGGCDADCHRRRYKTKLISMAMQGFGRVLVEPSGLYDTDEFFDTLYDEPLDRWYTVGSVIAVVDARLEENLGEDSEYILMSETANAGKIVFSHVQQATPQQLAAAKEHLNRVMEQFGCKRRFAESDFLCKDWDTLTAADFEELAACGRVHADFAKRPVLEKNIYQSLYFMNLDLNAQEILRRTERLFQAQDCGKIFRIKGFVPKETGGWLELNATPQETKTKPLAEGQKVILVIGEGLDKAKIAEYWG